MVTVWTFRRGRDGRVRGLVRVVIGAFGIPAGDAGEFVDDPYVEVIDGWRWRTLSRELAAADVVVEILEDIEFLDDFVDFVVEQVLER